MSVCLLLKVCSQYIDTCFPLLPSFLVRNRSCEKKKYLLPFEGDTSGVLKFSLSAEALAAMRHYQCIELPPAFVHALTWSSKSSEKHLHCQAFDITDTFPNNICLLENDVVMYCVDFEEVKVDGDEIATHYELKGFCFKSVEPAFKEPVSSAKIGFFKAKHIDFGEVRSFRAKSLVSKCFVFSDYKRAPSSTGRQEDAALDPIPTNVAERLRDFRREKRECERNVILEEIRNAYSAFEKVHVSYVHDFWWVHSIVVPGRFPNIGQ